jgi:iron complex outermembrane receptor protein
LSSQAISDATAHFDPADLRGLGQSTLVLSKRKRKIKVYINDVRGRDRYSIPFSAKEKYCVMELLPGSDAIAGNIILKKQTN